LKAILKHIVARTYKPLLVKYLSSTRVYRHNDLRLEIPPEVFHPGFFASTQLLLQYIENMSLSGKHFWEPGAGSGLISMYAAGKGATVTASDINPVAINYLHKNSAANNIRIDILQSDLYSHIPKKAFDIIAINPPYYKKHPVTSKDHAWYCGENGEYFSALFRGLSGYIHDKTEVIMVCCDGCDLQMINNAAMENGFWMKCMLIKPGLLEKNFIFKIEKL